MPAGHKLSCTFDGSVRGKYGAGGWAVYAEVREDIWLRVAQASFPVKGPRSSTMSEAIAAMSLLRFLEILIAQKRPLASIPECMESERPIYECPYLNWDVSASVVGTQTL